MRVRPLLISLSIALLVILTLFFFATPRASAPTPQPTGEIKEGSQAPTGVLYAEITDSCGPYFDGACLNARSGPGTEYPSIAQLRRGIVLRVVPATSQSGDVWYQVIFDEWLRYPDRAAQSFYISGSYVRVFYNGGPKEGLATSTASAKRIIIDRSEQRLSAYEGDTLFMDEPISTGLELTPTPRGVFHIYRKTPSRYMQGPIEGITAKTYDLPGVPWNLYFTAEGAVIHGTYWHDHFGRPWSNGCVNLPTDKARQLYEWAGLGTTVIVRD